MDSGNQHDPRRVGIAKPPGYSVAAFNPLLRSLLTWSLVERVDYEDGSHQWELTEAAQQRLDELVPARHASAASLAYLDHRCARCRKQRLTHLRDAQYLCEECEHLETPEGTPAAPPGRPRNEGRPFLRRQR